VNTKLAQPDAIDPTMLSTQGAQRLQQGPSARAIYTKQHQADVTTRSIEMTLVRLALLLYGGELPTYPQSIRGRVMRMQPTLVLVRPVWRQPHLLSARTTTRGAGENLQAAGHGIELG